MYFLKLDSLGLAFPVEIKYLSPQLDKNGSLRFE